MSGQHLQDLVQTLECALTQSGKSLFRLSGESPLLLLRLRQADCTFCRGPLGDIARARHAIEKHGLAGVARICDRKQKLYKAFGLKRGMLLQLFGPKALWRAGALARHGIARRCTDRFQMPGMFLPGKALIVRRYRHRTAGDRPDYAGACEVNSEGGV
jgi:hypothetical protein